MAITTKKSALFLSIILFSLCTSTAFAAKDSLATIAKRIAPVGKVNIAVPEKNTQPTTSPSNQIEKTALMSKKKADSSNGEKIYTAHCKLCHESGAAGAPKLTDANAWQVRNQQGIAVLIEHAIKGYKIMPPKGGCIKCSNEDIKDAVNYMLKQVRS